MLQQATEGQEDNEVGDDDRVAETVLGFVLDPVDVAAHDAVEVAPADNKTEGHAALVDAFRVVGGPETGLAGWGAKRDRVQE